MDVYKTTKYKYRSRAFPSVYRKKNIEDIEIRHD